MSTQIFKNNIPNELLYELLKNICIKSDKCFIFNMCAFKKGIYNEFIQQFFEKCKEYYHNSKKKYLERKLTYNAFTTILRQICNYNKITYTSQIKYDKSNYEIVYYIYI